MTREVRKDAHRYRRAHEATTAALRRVVHAMRVDEFERQLAEKRTLHDLLYAAVAEALWQDVVRVAA